MAPVKTSLNGTDFAPYERGGAMVAGLPRKRGGKGVQQGIPAAKAVAGPGKRVLWRAPNARRIGQRRANASGGHQIRLRPATERQDEQTDDTAN
jgi:hypothetical protein